MAAMVVPAVEVANGHEPQWDADHCQHEKGKDGHVVTSPGNVAENQFRLSSLIYYVTEGVSSCQ